MLYRAFSVVARLAAAAAITLVPTPSSGQTPVPAGAIATPTEDDTLRFKMPTVTVTAQKEPEDRQKVPVSVTAVTRETIDAAGIRLVSEAAILSPNTIFTEGTARKLSNARVRGIGSSPNNPAITTYVDGVPQLNANSSSLELLDIDQIEFVRGPQSALFGRNTLGGVVTVASSRPSMAGWTGSLALPFANHGAWTVRGGVSGPVIADTLAVAFSVAQVSRDGFTVNDVTGNDLDSRSAFSVKGQVLWTPDANWEARVIVTGERARDGDYGLHDVAALRANPFHAARDFEGFADRDIFGTTIQVRRIGGSARLLEHDRHPEVDDAGPDRSRLHAAAVPAARQRRRGPAVHAGAARRVLGAGADPAVRRAPACAGRPACSSSRRATNRTRSTASRRSSSRRSPVSQHSPRSALDDSGVGLFGQATVTLGERVRSVGRRALRSRVEGRRRSRRSTSRRSRRRRASTPRRASRTSRRRCRRRWRLRPEHTLYATVGRGFKAGGFNSASPAGREAYDEEQTWNVEGGDQDAVGRRPRHGQRRGRSTSTGTTSS